MATSDDTGVTPDEIEEAIAEVPDGHTVTDVRIDGASVEVESDDPTPDHPFADVVHENDEPTFFRGNPAVRSSYGFITSCDIHNFRDAGYRVKQLRNGSQNKADHDDPVLVFEEIPNADDE